MVGHSLHSGAAIRAVTRPQSNRVQRTCLCHVNLASVGRSRPLELQPSEPVEHRAAAAAARRPALRAQIMKGHAEGVVWTGAGGLGWLRGGVGGGKMDGAWQKDGLWSSRSWGGAHLVGGGRGGGAAPAGPARMNTHACEYCDVQCTRPCISLFNSNPESCTCKTVSQNNHQSVCDPHLRFDQSSVSQFPNRFRGWMKRNFNISLSD